MSDAEKLQITFERFVREFVLPLLEGRTLSIGQPIGSGALAHFELAKLSDADVDDALSKVIAVRTRSLAHGVVPAPLDRGALCLLLAGYNLAALADSSLDSWPASSATSKIGHWIARSLARVELPRTEGDVVLRHLAVDSLLNAFRTDVVLSNWGGTRVYRGRSAPAEPTLPRVFFSRTESRQSLTEALSARSSSLDVTQLVRQLIALSPFTEIVKSHKLPSFRWSVATLGVLRSSALSDALARAIVAEGLTAYGESWIEAFRSLQTASADETTIVASFLRKVFVLHATTANASTEVPVNAAPLFALGTYLLNGTPTADLALAHTELSLVRAAVQSYSSTLSREVFLAVQPLLPPAFQPTPTEIRS